MTTTIECVKETKPTPKERAYQKMAKLTECLGSDNKKRIAKAKTQLNKLAFANPEHARALGYTGEAPTISRVMQFGCLTGPVVLDRPEYRQEADNQMRLNHDLYNHLVNHSETVYRLAVADLMTGENFREYRKLHKRIGDAYQKIRDLNREARGRADEDAVAPFLAKIKGWKEDQMALAGGVREEIAAFYRGSVYKSIMAPKAEGGFLAAITGEAYTRFATNGGLSWHTTNTTIGDFTAAFKATFKSPRTILTGLKHRYERRDGEYPKSIQSWNAWDHSGNIDIRVTQAYAGRKGDPFRPNPDKSLQNVMKGLNSVFRVRPITEEDLKRFPFTTKLDMARASTKRVYVAELLVRTKSHADGQPVFASIPFVMHRPFPGDGTLCRATIESKRDGLRTRYSLLVTVNFTAKKPVAKGAVARLELFAKEQGGLNFQEGQFGRAMRTQNAEFTAWASAKGQKFEWLRPDGTLCANKYIDAAFDYAKVLDNHVNEYVKFAVEALDDLSKTTKLPTWFVRDEHRVDTRRGIRRAYRAWRHEVQSSADNTNLAKKHFSDLRQIGRTLVKQDWEVAVNKVAFKVESLLSFNPKHARFFAILSVFTERFEHMYPWAVNLRDKAQRRRLNEYRQFAATFLAGAKELHVPKTGLNQRFLSDGQKAVSPSLLLKALREFAEREGIAITEEE